jgi:cell division septum initiation protein DivIVA
MSRATIYRSAELRSLIGVRGETARAIPRIAHLRLLTNHQELKRQLRELRRDLDSAEERYEKMRKRLQAAEDRNRRGDDTVMGTFGADELTSAARSLRSTARRLGTEECRRARRQIARVLHPDLFPASSAAHDLALELLKSLNALID